MKIFSPRAVVRLKHEYPYLIILAKKLINLWKGFSFYLITPLRLLPVGSTFIGPVRSIVSPSEMEHDPSTSCAKFLHTHECSVDLDFNQSPDDPFLAEQKLAVRYRGHVVEFSDARYWGRYAGWIIDCKNRVVSDVSQDSPWSGPVPHGAMNVLRLPKVKHLRGTAAVLSTPEADGNYGHWMLDLLPRFFLLREADVKLGDIDQFVINHKNTSYQKYSLARLGIPISKVISPERSTHIKCDRLLVPSYVRGDFLLQDFVPNFLNQLFDGCAPSDINSDRIYVSREGAEIRRIVNADEVRLVLENLDFQVVYPEKYSIDEQVSIFRQARFVVGPHGSGFVNLVFSQPGTRVLEICSPNFVKNNWWQICQNRRCHYEGMLARRASYSSSARDPSLIRTQDIVVDIDELRRRVELMLGDN